MNKIFSFANDSKRALLGLLTAVLVLPLSGCGDAIPEMTEEQTRMVEQYAADLILKYDVDYKSNILSEEEIAAKMDRLEQRAQLEVEVQQQKALEQAGEEESSSSESQEGEAGEAAAEETKIADIDQFFGLDGFDITYNSYQICDSYPTQLDDNDWQGVTMAGSGNKLIAFSYTATNTSGNDSTLDFASLAPIFAFKINGNITKSALTTLLLNDMSNYRDTIAAGESTELVLLVEVSEDVANDLQSITMIMKSGSDKAELTIL